MHPNYQSVQNYHEPRMRQRGCRAAIKSGQEATEETEGIGVSCFGLCCVLGGELFQVIDDLAWDVGEVVVFVAVGEGLGRSGVAGVGEHLIEGGEDGLGIAGAGGKASAQALDGGGEHALFEEEWDADQRFAGQEHGGAGGGVGVGEGCVAGLGGLADVDWSRGESQPVGLELGEAAGWDAVDVGDGADR